MAGQTQRGFVACRKLGGGAAIQKTFPVSASSNNAFFLGDAVILNASGNVAPYKTTGVLVGVITALMRSSGGKPMPLTFSEPTNGPFLTSGTAGFAVVNVDDHQTYVAQFGTNFTQAVVGAVAKVSAGAPNTANGLSGQTLSGTVTTSSDADAGFQILGLAPVEMLNSRTSAAAPDLVECKLASGGVFGGNPV